MKMLHKNPAKRYQTPQALLNALNEILQRYSAVDAQNIIKCAVLGSELPQGVKKRISSGLLANLNFLFFSLRQNIAEMCSSSPRKAVKTEYAAQGAACFTFQIDPDAAADISADFSLQVQENTMYRIVSDSGSGNELKSDGNGKLEIKAISPGEYRIIPVSKENL
jgi:hypothetical protein